MDTKSADMTPGSGIGHSGWSSFSTSTVFSHFHSPTPDSLSSSSFQKWITLELSAAQHLDIKKTDAVSDLPSCERVLVYLTRLTWTSDEASAAFAREIELAIAAGVRTATLDFMVIGTTPAS